MCLAFTPIQVNKSLLLTPYLLGSVLGGQATKSDQDIILTLKSSPFNRGDNHICISSKFNIICIIKYVICTRGIYAVFNVKYTRCHIYYIIFHISSRSKVCRGPGERGDKHKPTVER